MVSWSVGRSDSWSDGQSDGQSDSWSVGRSDGWSDGQSDGQSDGWSDGQLVSQTVSQIMFIGRPRLLVDHSSVWLTQAHPNYACMLKNQFSKADQKVGT